MTDSWEPEPDDSRSVEDGQGEIESQANALSSDEVLRDWVERLDHELAARNLTIEQLRAALENATRTAEGDEVQADEHEDKHEDQVEDRVAEESSLGESSDQRILVLENVISERDALIADLQGRIASQEANLAALHLEWDRLRDWVEDVEERVDLAGCYDEVFNSAPFAPDRACGTRFESTLIGCRAEWEIERGALLREVEALKVELHSAQSASIEPIDSLESENVRLIETLEHNQAEYERLLKAHQRLGDDYQSLEREHDKAINELRAEIQEGQLREQRSAELSASREKQEPKSNPLESDERIRAFRLHLDGIHAQESAKRAPKGGILGIRWFKSVSKRS